MSAAPTRYAWLSVATAVVVIGLKTGAWWVSDSVALLSDALETLTNLGGAVMALLMLRLAAQPPDDEHAYGHHKAEYFSSGFEGMLIFLAAVLIVLEAVPRLLHPQPIASPGLSLGVALLATMLNFATAQVLSRASRRWHSVTLDADARHLMADVWTTLGVVVGLALTFVTGWLWLDPLIALLVAANVLREGWTLVREAADGLMDAAWPEHEQATLREVLARFERDCEAPLAFHALRTRRSASRRYLEFHVLVPGEWTVQRGHDLLEAIESALADRLPNLVVSTHLEPAEDPRSYEEGAVMTSVTTWPTP